MRRSTRGVWAIHAVLVFGVGCGGQSERAPSSSSSSGDGGVAGTTASGAAGGGFASGGTQLGAAGLAGEASAGRSGGTAGSAGSGLTSGAGGVAGSSGATSRAGGAGDGGASVAGAGGASGAGDGGASVAGAGGASGAGDGGGGVAGEGGAAGGTAGAGGVADVPGFDDLIVRSSNMAPYEGLRVIATFDQNIAVDSRSAPRAGTVTGGAFTFVWEQGFDRNSFGTYVVLFVDRDGDGWCNEGEEPAWSFFGSNDATRDQPITLDFDPGATANTNPITCAEFDDWFEEKYMGL